MQFLHWLDVPVYLEGNIIDLGVYKLHVAEACSGLRYLFPILSFSYIFAVLYRGPMWHKAVLLLSAVPITVLMNSVRIAIAGYIVNVYGRRLGRGLHPLLRGLGDLPRLRADPVRRWPGCCCSCAATGSASSTRSTSTPRGLGAQAMRLALVQPSRALIAGALMMVAAAAAWEAGARAHHGRDRPRALRAVPARLGDWRSAPPEMLDANVARALGADDYHQVDLARPDAAAPVGLFMAWYADQTQGGVHSPEICLPSSGWEIAWLERTDIAGEIGWPEPVQPQPRDHPEGPDADDGLLLVRAARPEGRLGHRGEVPPADGRHRHRPDRRRDRPPDHADRRRSESDAAAEARLRDALGEVVEPLPRFIPEG